MSTYSCVLLQQMLAASRGGVVKVVIEFANDDVPDYLENLRRFREESRKVKIPIEMRT